MSEINVGSTIKFEGMSDEVLAKFKQAAIAGLTEAAGEIQAQVIRNTRTDTGQLKSSWKYTVDDNKMEAQIGSPLENAIWEEFGTGEYALEGNGRKTPWYIPVDSYKGHKKPTFNGKVTIVYGENGKAFYKTNGKKPRRMLYNAFNDKKAKVEAIITEKFKEKMK